MIFKSIGPGSNTKLELMYYFTYFFTVVPSNSCMFLSCRPFVVNTFSTGLVGVEVSSAFWDDGGKIGRILN